MVDRKGDSRPENLLSDTTNRTLSSRANGTQLLRWIEPNKPYLRISVVAVTPFEVAQRQELHQPSSQEKTG